MTALISYLITKLLLFIAKHEDGESFVFNIMVLSFVFIQLIILITIQVSIQFLFKLNLDLNYFLKVYC